MGVITRGIRNAFRNMIRGFALVVILALSMGLSLVMLVSYQAVDSKITTTLASIGNTVTIRPAGFSAGSDVNNALTSDQMVKVAAITHVTAVSEALTDRLQTTGTTSIPTGVGGQGASFQVRAGNNTAAATTSLRSVATLSTTSGAGRFFSGGSSGTAPQLPSNFSLPISVVGANYPGDPNNLGATAVTLVSGSAIDGNANNNEAMISSAMATKNNVKVGDSFTAYAVSITITGIFTSGSQRGDNTIIFSLPTEQRLSAQGTNITDATATVDSLANLTAATTAITSTLGTSADVTSNIDQANAALAPLANVKTISLYGLIGALGAAVVIIFLSMIMIVRERRREIGILKAIGASNVRIALQFMSEASTLSVFAGVVGLIFVFIAANPITSALISSSTSTGSTGTGGGSGVPGGRGGGGFRGFGGGTFRALGNPVLNGIQTVQAVVGWNTVLYGLGAAIIIALVGSALASYFISKVRPAEVMRAE